MHEGDYFDKFNSTCNDLVREVQVHPHEEPYARSSTSILSAMTVVQIGRKVAEREVGHIVTYAIRCRIIGEVRKRKTRRVD